MVARKVSPRPRAWCRAHRASAVYRITELLLSGHVVLGVPGARMLQGVGLCLAGCGVLAACPRALCPGVSLALGQSLPQPGQDLTPRNPPPGAGLRVPPAPSPPQRSGCEAPAGGEGRGGSVKPLTCSARSRIAGSPDPKRVTSLAGEEICLCDSL